MRGAQIFYYFGVLGYVVMIEDLQQRSRWRVFTTPSINISYIACSMTTLDREKFLELASMRMPFGKYTGRLLIDLPEPYVVWFAGKGFPEGKLGEMLNSVYEIKINGLEYLFDPYR